MMMNNRYAISKTDQRLPALVWVVLCCTFAACFGGVKIFGYNISGIAWVVPFAFALMILSRYLTKASFPIKLWIPWILLLFTYLLLSDSQSLDPRVSPLQRTMQLLSPLVVGMAVSIFRAGPVQLARFIRLCRYLSMIILGVVAFKLGNVIFTSAFSEYSGMAAEMMTNLLLCSLLVNSYLITHEKRSIILWFVLLMVPVINLTRTAIATTLLSWPLSLAPMKLSKRMIGLMIIAAIGVGIFYSPRFQKKTFYSGSGNFSDIRGDDFDTSGRRFIWEYLWEMGNEEFYFGHGTGAAETFVFRITRSTAYPHNDWLLTFFDYGIFGVIVITGSILLTMRHAMRAAKTTKNMETQLLLITGASAFILFMIMMVTDNIMVYASFFGNLHFTMLGLAYGAVRAERKSAELIR